MEMWPLWMACFYLWFLPISPELQRFKHPIEANGSIRCLVIGDWGRRGRYNQSQIAFQMGRTGEELNIDFVISTGDNFYQNGLKSLNDPSLAESFTKVYTAKSLQKQWYSVLGNHDYRGNVEVQLSPILRKKDSRWFCRRSYILNTEIAEFFFVDTTPFVDKYFLKQKHTYDWRGVIPRKKYLTELSEDLETALRDSAANWKIVIGHHTIRSIGHHGDTEELVGQLLPILEANNVDMYINGHDHCLQHISSTRSPIEFFTSGGGSKAWKGDIKEMNQDKMKFYYDGQGFMSLELTKTIAKDLESALRDSAANWKIVIGHHTIRSIGHQGDTEELVRQLLPILEANNVDMYINGHDHCLQHISSTRSPIEFFTGGGGSKKWKGDIYKMKFYHDGQGFRSQRLFSMICSTKFCMIQIYLSNTTIPGRIYLDTHIYLVAVIITLSCYMHEAYNNAVAVSYSNSVQEKHIFKDPLIHFRIPDIIVKPLAKTGKDSWLPKVNEKPE